MRRHVLPVLLTGLAAVILAGCGAARHKRAVENQGRGGGPVTRKTDAAPRAGSGGSQRTRPSVAVRPSRAGLRHHPHAQAVRLGSFADPTVGELLTTTDGTWTGDPRAFVYRWETCDTAGDDCGPVDGATGRSYRIVRADVGRTIRVRVTASNSHGSATQVSAPAGVVIGADRVNVANFFLSDDSDSVTATDAASDYAKVVQLQYNGPATRGLVDAIHAVDPGVMVLMYADPSSAGGWTSRRPSNGCISSSQNQPAWDLYDGLDPIPGKTNLGESAFDETCITQAMSQARSADFDGVFWDEINAVPTFSFSQTCVNAYQAASCSLYDQNGEATWVNNVQTFITAVGRYDEAHGMDSVLNVGGADIGASTSVWQQWVGTSGITGGMDESFGEGLDGSTVSYAQWQGELTNDVWSEANDRIFLGMHYDNDQDQESSDTYGLASMLLAADGYSSYSSEVDTLNRPGYRFFPEYLQAQDLGAPRGTYTAQTSGDATVYMRRFADGLVIVNPTAVRSDPVALHGTYFGTGDEPRTVDSITLPGQSGDILTGG